MHPSSVLRNRKPSCHAVLCLADDAKMRLRHAEDCTSPGAVSTWCRLHSERSTPASLRRRCRAGESVNSESARTRMVKPCDQRKPADKSDPGFVWIQLLKFSECDPALSSTLVIMRLLGCENPLYCPDMGLVCLLTNQPRKPLPQVLQLEPLLGWYSRVSLAASGWMFPDHRASCKFEGIGS